MSMNVSKKHEVLAALAKVKADLEHLYKAINPIRDERDDLEAQAAVLEGIGNTTNDEVARCRAEEKQAACEELGNIAEDLTETAEKLVDLIDNAYRELSKR